MVQTKYTIEASPPGAPARALPRLSQRAGFWAVAYAFLAVSAFSTAPSSLYGLYQQQEHLSSLTITIVYAVYAIGIVVSLLLAGHVSDWYGRRAVMLPALAVAVAAALVFLAWRSLAGLAVARVFTGLLARYQPHALTLPYTVFLAALIAAVVAVILAPEGHGAVHPRPRYHLQRLAAPANGRRQFVAATTGAFTSFAVGGLLAGLTGTFLAGPFHHPSPALIGLAIFLTFASGVLVQTTTPSRPTPRLVAAGIAPTIIGVSLLVASAWTSPPSLALFLIGAAVAVAIVILAATPILVRPAPEGLGH
jgi:MFS family permease